MNRRDLLLHKIIGLHLPFTGVCIHLQTSKNVNTTNNLPRLVTHFPRSYNTINITLLLIT